MNIGWSLLTTAALIAIYLFYQKMIKKNEVTEIPFEEQDDAYCRIASKINKCIDRADFGKAWEEIDLFKTKYGNNHYGMVDVNSLTGMLTDRELIVAA